VIAFPYVKAVLYTSIWNRPDEEFKTLLLHDIYTLLPMKFIRSYIDEMNASVPMSPRHEALANFSEQALRTAGVSSRVSSNLRYKVLVSLYPSRQSLSNSHKFPIF
jgi:hypothetical protein